MAGKGFAPKDPRTLAGHRGKNAAANLRVIEVEPAAQPDLPEFEVTIWRDGIPVIESFTWPLATRGWWRMWSDSPLSADFTEADWSYLLDTAVLHAAYWKGDMKQAAELRQRVAKFGQTPEDRARLRIQFAAADEADEKRGKTGPSAPDASGSRARRGPLRSVDDAETA